MSISLELKPLLRWPLDVQYIESQGQQFVILRDSQGIAPEPLVLPAALLSIVSRFDGTHSLNSILEEGGKYGVTVELLETIYQDLDELHYLENERFTKRRAEVEREFAQRSVRTAAHAGAVYPAEKDELAKAIGQYLTEAGVTNRGSHQAKALAAIVCPHIDYRRGWRAYASTYDQLAAAEVPDVIFLIGTSHQAGRGMFHLTRKDFETPFGVIPTARGVVESVAARYGEKRAFGEELLHRTEHSLELQLPFLQHCYRAAKMPELVPILVGSFHHYFFQDRSPLEDAEVSDFVDSVAEGIASLEASGKKVLFYAGVDFAHVGTHFGDQEPCDELRLKEIERQDQALLSSIMDGDESALFAHMQTDCDARRVCGYPSMYTMFAALRRANWLVTGKTVEYRQAVETESDCVVTFASAVWKRRYGSQG